MGDAAPVDSLALIFDPAIAEKLAGCGISLLDTPQEVFPGGARLSRARPEEPRSRRSRQGVAALEKIRPYIRKFHSSQYINDLANGDLCVALGYSGDVVQARNRAREAGNAVEIAFRVPQEGAMMSVDMLGIPADAPHPENALRFIDYLLRPAVIADITNAVSYPNPNVAGDGARQAGDPRRPGDLPARRMSAAASTSICRRRAPTSAPAPAPGRASNRAR